MIITNIGDKRCFIEVEYDSRSEEYNALCRVVTMAPDGQQMWHDRPVIAYSPKKEQAIEFCLNTIQQRK